MPGCALHPFLTAPVLDLLIPSVPADIATVLAGSSLGLTAFLLYQSSGSDVVLAAK